MSTELNSTVFDPTGSDPELIGFNQVLIPGLIGMGWSFPPESPQALRDALAAGTTPEMVYFAPHAETRTIAGPGGDLDLRVIPADGPPKAIYLHCHGGGFAIGSAAGQDASLERISKAAGVTVVSIEYRLAPENPYPAGLDDCEAAALWVLDNAQQVWGTSTVIIGGESAGANLALCTLIRVNRARPGAIAAANLLYGNYDISMTPSQRVAVEEMITTESLAWFYDQYVPDPAGRTDPDVSPLYADLTGLPPTLLSVGNEDSMLDDSLFLAMRMLVAGVDCELLVIPGAEHAFDTAPVPAAQQAVEKLDAFVARHANGPTGS